MRIDPVPFPGKGHTEAFAHGYAGGSPATLYAALVRCALDEPAGAFYPLRNEDSQLWKAITTTTGPLRLSWPQAVLWARHDIKVGACITPTRS